MPHRRRALAWLLIVCWAAAGCGTGASQSPSASPTTTTTGASTSAAASTSTSAATTTAGFAGTLIEARVRGGTVDTAKRRVGVKRGERVRITVESDQGDEVHVHGYDLRRPVGPGKPATIEFAADLPGIYEVELEAAKRRLLELEVR